MNNYNCTQPIVITKDNDHFNYLNKVRFIKEYLENNDEYLAKNNMIALYGKWGSGKSSVMKTLMESENPSLKINDNQFHTLFFEAWKFESDPNLAQSLFEAICVKFPTITTTSKEALLNIYSVLKGFAKATTFSIGIPSTCDLEFSAEKLIDEVEKRGSEEKAYYTQHEKFKKNFESILPKDKKIIIFVDDLDRCESENIIKLLSAIKLFFTLSDRLIFVCGVDKSAITKALKSKYHNDEEKAEEYLEKIFSFNFSMPKVNEFDRLIIDTFGDNEKVSLISNFFKAINFDNPRHLKKVLNKYKYLVSIKKSPIAEANLIPNIIIDSNDDFNSKVLSSILILYVIILYEYHFDSYYLEFKNFNEKKHNYSEKIKLFRYEDRNQGTVNSEYSKPIDTSWFIDTFDNVILSKIGPMTSVKYGNFDDVREKIKAYTLFTSITHRNGSFHATGSSIKNYGFVWYKLNTEFPLILEENIMNRFALFFIEKLATNELKEDYKLITLFQMAETLL